MADDDIKDMSVSKDVEEEEDVEDVVDSGDQVPFEHNLAGVPGGRQPGHRFHRTQQMKCHADLYSCLIS